MLAPNAYRFEGKNHYEMRDRSTGETLKRYIVYATDGTREDVYATSVGGVYRNMHDYRCGKEIRSVTPCECGHETWCGFKCPYERYKEPQYPYHQSGEYTCDFECKRDWLQLVAYDIKWNQASLEETAKERNIAVDELKTKINDIAVVQVLKKDLGSNDEKGLREAVREEIHKDTGVWTEEGEDGFAYYLA